MTEITRRELIRFLGAAGVWTLAGCGKYPGPSQVALVPRGWHRGEERWVSSTCLQCPGGCGIRVRVYEGRAVKIEGNPEHPLNRGGLCPKGQAGLQALYDPDRIPGPMRKIGGRSSTRWEAISWDEAIGTVAGRLRELRDAGKPEAALFMGGRFPGHMRGLFARLARAYGTPNLLDAESICNRSRRLAMYLQQGVYDLPGYDLKETNHFVVFGAGFLESWQPTTYLLRMYGEMRRGRRGRRAKIVVVDPRCGVGASKADWWIPIRPGTDGALALGMAHVIVKEDLYDRAFVKAHTYGFDDIEGAGAEGAEGFKTLVLRDYAPERVEEITGVPAQSVQRLAREFATTRPAVAAAGRGPGLHTNGLFAHMAIHALNALVGNLEAPRGVVVQQSPPFKAWAEPACDETAQGGLARSPLAAAGPRAKGWPANGCHGALVDALLRGASCPVEAALIYYTNPIFSGPDTARCRRAFDRIPFLVSFSPFMDDTTARADLVLPDSTYLERLEDDFIVPSVGFPVLNLRQPVMQPLHDTRHTGDVLIRLAQQIGGAVKEAFPWESYEGALKEAAAGVAALRQGSFTATDTEAFWGRLKERGVWSGGPYRFGDLERALRTPTGKFEFFPVAWRDHVIARRTQAEANDGAGTDLPLMPRYEPPRFTGDPKRYPLHLNTYKSMMHAEGRGGNQPWLQESFGVQLNERWKPWVEINPDTAEELGIHDKDLVWVESERGRLRLRARLHPGLGPEMVNIPFEYGHTSYGRWAAAIKGNPNEIISSLVDEHTGNHAINATRVRVRRA